jgi:hypothetical protein
MFAKKALNEIRISLGIVSVGYDQICILNEYQDRHDILLNPSNFRQAGVNMFNLQGFSLNENLQDLI